MLKVYFFTHSSKDQQDKKFKRRYKVKIAYSTWKFERNGMALRNDSFTNMQRKIAKGRPIHSSATGMAIDEQMVLYCYVLPGSVINLLIQPVQN